MAERRRFEITDVSGGMNPDRHPLYIEENEAADLLNFRIDRVGSLVGRGGRSKYGVEISAPDNILSLGRWVGADRRTDYKVLAAVSDGNLYLVDENPSSPQFGQVLFSGLDPDAEGMFLELEDLVVYANGVDDLIVYDGTSAFPLHIDPPASISVTTGEPGTLTGTYQYAAAYISEERGWQSPATVFSADVTVTSEGAKISVPPSSHPAVDKVRLFRTTDGGATLMYLDTIDNDSSPEYVDDGSSALSPALTPTNGGYIPGEDHGKRAQNVAYHKGRLWVSIGDTLFWSLPGEPGLFPYFTNTRVPFEGNDRIVALKAFQDYLMVFGEKNTILVAGDGGLSGLDIQLVRQDANIGASSRHAIVELDNQLVFLSDDGLFVYPGFGEFASKLTRTICDASKSCRLDSSMIYLSNERALWLSITNQTWVIHLPNHGLSRYDFYMRKPLQGGKNGVSAPVWVDARHAVEGHGNSTFLNVYGGNGDFGEDISYVYSSKIWHVESPTLVKFWRRVGLYTSTGADIRISLTCPDTSLMFNKQLVSSIRDDLSRWEDSSANSLDPDVSLWDAAVWAAGGLVYYVNPLPAQSLYGRSFQVEVTSYTDTDLELHVPISFDYRVSDRFLGR